MSPLLKGNNFEERLHYYLHYMISTSIIKTDSFGALKYGTWDDTG